MSEPVHVVTCTVVSMLSNPVVKSGCHKSAGFSMSKSDCIAITSLVVSVLPISVQ